MANINKVRPVWAEIDLRAIAYNLQEIRRITSPGAQIMAVVKANGYGHGALQVARVALANGATRLAVATLGEALALRKEGIQAPVMVLGYTPAYQADQVITGDVIQTVFDLESARALSAAAMAAGKKVKIHLKIDTGMGRLGFQPGERDLAVIGQIAALPGLETEGIFSHFAAADLKDKSFSERQFAQFIETVEKIEGLGLKIPLKHMANSAAIIDLPHTHLDLVRPGISLYGYYPSEEVAREKLVLKPALSLKCEVAFCKEVEAGSPISYGCTYQAPAREIIATLPLGYADGYTRLLSSKGEVLVRGQRAPIVGRVCMDQCMALVSHIHGVKTGDEVVLIGSQGNQRITADHLAQKIGTISYEILCLISGRVPRIYRDQDIDSREYG